MKICVQFQVFTPYIPLGSRNTWRNIKRIEKNWKKKVQKSLDIYHLGQSTTITSIIELIKGLVKRDYPHLDIFDGSKVLQIFVPEIWLNKCPEIIGEMEYQELREGLKVSIYDQTKSNISLE